MCSFESLCKSDEKGNELLEVLGAENGRCIKPKQYSPVPVHKQTLNNQINHLL